MQTFERRLTGLSQRQRIRSRTNNQKAKGLSKFQSHKPKTSQRNGNGNGNGTLSGSYSDYRGLAHVRYGNRRFGFRRRISNRKRRIPSSVSKYDHRRSELRSKMMEAIHSNQTPIPTPKLMNNIFVISIRSDRASAMMRRLGTWRNHAKLFWGTKWNTINVKHWISTGKVIKSLRFKNRKKPLCRGELGCYDSHVRVWKEIVNQGLSYALVLEDDAEISMIHSRQLNDISDQLENRKDWDVVILYPIHHRSSRFQNPENLRFIPIQHMTGLAGYLISLAGAKKLIQKPFPIQGPVDDYVPKMSKMGRLKLFMVSPALGGQINRHDSDTSRY